MAAFKRNFQPYIEDRSLLAKFGSTDEHNVGARFEIVDIITAVEQMVMTKNNWILDYEEELNSLTYLRSVMHMLTKAPHIMKDDFTYQDALSMFKHFELDAKAFLDPGMSDSEIEVYDSLFQSVMSEEATLKVRSLIFGAAGHTCTSIADALAACIPANDKKISALTIDEAADVDVDGVKGKAWKQCARAFAKTVQAESLVACRQLTLNTGDKQLKMQLEVLSMLGQCLTAGFDAGDYALSLTSTSSILNDEGLTFQCVMVKLEKLLDSFIAQRSGDMRWDTCFHKFDGAGFHLDMLDCKMQPQFILPEVRARMVEICTGLKERALRESQQAQESLTSYMPVWQPFKESLFDEENRSMLQALITNPNYDKIAKPGLSGLNAFYVLAREMNKKGCPFMSLQQLHRIKSTLAEAKDTVCVSWAACQIACEIAPCKNIDVRKSKIDRLQAALVSKGFKWSEYEHMSDTFDLLLSDINFPSEDMMTEAVPNADPAEELVEAAAKGAETPLAAEEAEAAPADIPPVTPTAEAAEEVRLPTQS